MTCVQIGQIWKQSIGHDPDWWLVVGIRETNVGREAWMWNAERRQFRVFFEDRILSLHWWEMHS